MSVTRPGRSTGADGATSSCCEPGFSSQLSEMCALPAGELETRVAKTRARFSEIVEHSERLPQGLAVEFAARPGLREELEDWVSFERQCCSGLSFSVQPKNTADSAPRLRLEVLNPKAGGDLPPEFLRALTEAGREPAAESVARRVAIAMAVASSGAALLCCVLPLALVPLLAGSLGAGALSLLAGVDSVPVIAAVAVLIGALSWRWQGRRSRAAVAPGGRTVDCGCD